ncbi:hypothetical protein FD755_002131, partial [Muntiacus reevesi]
RQVDSSSSILLSQDYFGYSRFFLWDRVLYFQFPFNPLCLILNCYYFPYLESYKNSLESVEKNVSEDSCLWREYRKMRDGKINGRMRIRKNEGRSFKASVIFRNLRFEMQDKLIAFLSFSCKNDKVDLIFDCARSLLPCYSRKQATECSLPIMLPGKPRAVNDSEGQKGLEEGKNRVNWGEALENSEKIFSSTEKMSTLNYNTQLTAMNMYKATEFKGLKSQSMFSSHSSINLEIMASMELHVFPILIPPPASLSIPSLWFFGPFFDWVIYFSGIELQELLTSCSIQFSSVAQSLSKLMSIELVMPSNHLILCRLLLLLPSIFLSTRNFSNESSKGLSRVFSNITRVKRQSTELEKYLQIINKSQSLKNKCCMILKISPCAVILEPKKIKSVTISLSWNSAKYLAQLDFHIKYVSKLETELEGAKQKFKQMTDSYQKEIEDKKLLEENLLGEVAKAKVVADEAVKLQKEIDIRCQHKIAEMVALMEKHKHQYDKIVEERDSELGLYKSKEQEHSSVKASLETELSNLRNELWSVKKDLETEREEKKTQTSLLETPETSYWKLDSKVPLSQNASRSFLSADQSRSSKDKRDYLRTPAKNNLSTPLPKAYTVKTPTKLKIQQRGNKNVPIEESNSKKRKMVFEFDINSDSSETTDLLSMVSEEETLRKLYKNNNPPISHLCVRTPKKTPSSLMTPGSMPKSETMRKMQEDRWAVIAKMDRKQKLKEAEKLFV